MKPVRMMLAVALLAAGFVGGFGYSRWYGPTALARQGMPGRGQPKQRKILYYVDPMHPAYKSDRPGIAPDCGMTLEPVYEDGLSGSPKTERRILKYRDPQAPNYTSGVSRGSIRKPATRWSRFIAMPRRWAPFKSRPKSSR